MPLAIKKILTSERRPKKNKSPRLVASKVNTDYDDLKPVIIKQKKIDVPKFKSTTGKLVYQ